MTAVLELNLEKSRKVPSVADGDTKPIGVRAVVFYTLGYLIFFERLEMKILIIAILLLFVGCAKKESSRPRADSVADSTETDKILAKEAEFAKRVYFIGYNDGVGLYMVDGHEIIKATGLMHSPACVERDFEKQKH